jgi:hypothetical protein
MPSVGRCSRQQRTPAACVQRRPPAARAQWRRLTVLDDTRHSRPTAPANGTQRRPPLSPNGVRCSSPNGVRRSSPNGGIRPHSTACAARAQRCLPLAPNGVCRSRPMALLAPPFAPNSACEQRPTVPAARAQRRSLLTIDGIPVRPTVCAPTPPAPPHPRLLTQRPGHVRAPRPRTPRARPGAPGLSSMLSTPSTSSRTHLSPRSPAPRRFPPARRRSRTCTVGSAVASPRSAPSRPSCARCSASPPTTAGTPRSRSRRLAQPCAPPFG